ncbi:MAG: cobalamin biosynthesis protein CobW [Thermales bacterium]|nr:cobalamin biosynthesis protein CobW [Thermales bacterium]
MENGKVDLATILNTGKFDMEEMQKSASWIQELASVHIPESEEYGIKTFTYRARKPFDERKLITTLTSKLPNGILRAKGFYWSNKDENYIFELAIAGRSLNYGQSIGMWWVSAPKEYWPKDPQTIQKIQTMYFGNTGDRRQELVFIGKNVDFKQIEILLNSCLVR